MLRRFILLLVLTSFLAQLPSAQAQARTTASETSPMMERLILEEPSYFAIGAGTRKNGSVNSVLTDPNNQAKFRLALRLPILPLNERSDGFYFSFSEEALWNPFDGSAASLDNRYTPEFIGWWGVGDGAGWEVPSLGLSYTHQSNGLLGDNSRSWNRAMLRAAFGDHRRHPLLLTLSTWYPFAVDYRMPDLEEYVGQGTVLLLWQPLLAGRGWGVDILGLTLRSGVTVNRRLFTNLEATLLCDPGVFFDLPVRTTPHLMLQYFVGRGESILRYKSDTHSIRIGLAVLR
ncbi:phospholipase A [bacterium]|nr:phospholipase A [bacterium]